MILAFIGLALADPIALRAPSGAVAVVLGVPDSSVAVSVAPHVGVSIDARALDAVGASVGYRSDLFRRDTGFGLEVSIAGGPMVPLLDPGLALSATPALALGWAHHSLDATIGVAIPAVARFTGFDLRIPVLGELWLGGRIGPVRVGGTFAAGQMWITGAPTEVGWHAGVYAAVGSAR
jgi:hypothetical protein